MTKQDCIGCTENFYNGNNPYGVKECWLFKDAKVITRYAIGVNDPTIKGNVQPVRKPLCYRSKGTVYLSTMPEHCR